MRYLLGIFSVCAVVLVMNACTKAVEKERRLIRTNGIALYQEYIGYGIRFL